MRIASPGLQQRRRRSLKTAAEQRPQAIVDGEGLGVLSGHKAGCRGNPGPSKSRGCLIAVHNQRAEMVEHEDADRGRQIAVAARAVDLLYQFRHVHALPVGDVAQGLPKFTLSETLVLCPPSTTERFAMAISCLWCPDFALHCGQDLTAVVRRIDFQTDQIGRGRTFQRPHPEERPKDASRRVATYAAACDHPSRRRALHGSSGRG